MRTRLIRKALGGYQIRAHGDVYQVIRAGARKHEAPVYTTRDLLAAEAWRRMHVQEIQERKNVNGMTWKEWANAALVAVSANMPVASEEVKAWLRGEDPSDWRAENERARMQ